MAEFRKGPKLGQVAMKPLKGFIVWFIAGALILLLLSILAGYSVYWRHTGKFPGLGATTAEKPEEVAPLHVKKMLNVTTWWSEDIVLDVNEFVDWDWLVDEFGQIRFNHDDDLIQKLPPRNCPDKKEVKGTGHIVCVQFRIEPGRSLAYGTMAVYKRKSWEQPAFR